MAYDGYRGQNVGRLIHFLYEVNFNLGENSYFGDGVIHADPFGKTLIATFTWNNDGDGDIPIIAFTEDYQHFQQSFEEVKRSVIIYEEMLGRVPYSLKKENEEEERERKLRQQRLYR